MDKLFLFEVRNQNMRQNSLSSDLLKNSQEGKKSEASRLGWEKGQARFTSVRD